MAFSLFVPGGRSQSMTLAVLCIILGAPLFAQNSTIEGLVTDPNGSIIVGAAVKLTNLDTSVAQHAESNDVGLYVMPLLRAGRYRIECSAPGFTAQDRPEVRLEVDQVARVDFQLSVGAVNQSIDVTGFSTLINSESSDVGQVIDSKRIVEMPLNGRNYLQLAQFTVGVQPAGELGRGNRTAADGGFLSMGIWTYQNSVVLDGNDNNSVLLGGALSYEAQAVRPPVDAVAEFKVVTEDSSAEYGYRLGAKVLVSTRSGTNTMHGTLFEFVRNNYFDGTNFFANRAGSKQPPYRQNQFGGTVGGPIIHNKTFYFGSFQGTRIRIGHSYTSSVPSLAARNGDVSQQPAQERNIFDPLTITGAGTTTATRSPFPGNVIPASRFDPVGKAIAAIYPLPNIPGRDNLTSNFFFAPSESDDTNQYDIRIDHYLSDRQRLFGRYSQRNENALQPGVLPLPADGQGWQTLGLNGYNAVLNYSLTLSPAMTNEVRVGWTHFPGNYDLPIRQDLNQQLGIKGAPGDSFNDGLNYGLARFTVAGYNQLGSVVNWPNFAHVDDLLIGDNLFWQKGRHNIKIGGEGRRMNTLRAAAGQRRGFFDLTGQYTSQQPNVAASRANSGNGVADLLLGWVSDVDYGNGRGENIISPYFGGYFQDSIKVTPRLTVNAGLRWELHMVPYFPDPRTQSVSRYLLPLIDGIAPADQKFVFPQDGHDCHCNNDFHDFGPRLGLAYRLTQNTVVRAGGGIYYAAPSALNEQYPRYFTGPPVYAEIITVESRETTAINLQSGFPPYTPRCHPARREHRHRPRFRAYALF